jgi:solute carrier family 24 (sodium/potassium/calcium exchanger), member 6
MASTKVQSYGRIGPRPPARIGRRRFDPRAFYLTILIVSAFAVFAFVKDRAATWDGRNDRASIVARDVLASSAGRLVKREVEVSSPMLQIIYNCISELMKTQCRMVHEAKDKCAYIQANCDDEEAGLLSYLSLYYCRLPNAQPLAFIVIALWLALLFTTIGIAASDFFCINLSTISNIMGMSESMAGVTFLAFGNGSPDVFSTFAAMGSNSGSLAVGELIGAAGFITAVVAGSMALVRPFQVAKKSFVRDVGFFIVAVVFMIYFLYDGKVQMWECAAMIVYYVFYVIFVIVWHWWFQRRSRRRQIDMKARGHYLDRATDDLEDIEEEDDEDAGAGERQGLLRGATDEDFGTLEGQVLSPRFTEEDDEEQEEEQQERWLAELSSNMRVRRRPRGERRPTATAIRPSLVGALEFRAVLSSLQKSRNIQTRPIHLRRYSDDPTYTAAQQAGQLGDHSIGPVVDDDHDLNAHDASARNLIDLDGANSSVPTQRIRAVSVNDVLTMRSNAGASIRSIAAPEIDLLSPSPPNTDQGGARSDSIAQDGPSMAGAASPSFSISPPPSNNPSRSTTPAPGRLQRAPTPDFLAPPDQGYFGAQHSRRSSESSTEGESTRAASLTQQHSRLDSQDSSRRGRNYPQIVIPREDETRSTPSSPFPAFTDSPLPMTARDSSPAESLRLPPASLESSQYYDHSGVDNDTGFKPVRWWPYRFLPAPEILYATLFPTIFDWQSKTLWEKFIGVIAAPSVFLLTVTLPVVDGDNKDDDDIDIMSQGPSRSNSHHKSTHSVGGTIIVLPSDSPSLEPEERIHDSSFGDYQIASPIGNGHMRQSASSARSHHLGEGAAEAFVDSVEHSYHPHSQSRNSLPRLPSTDERRRRDSTAQSIKDHIDGPALPTSAKDWNRWLVAVQAITAPIFIVLVVWANLFEDTASMRELIKWILIAAVVGLIFLAILIIFTTPETPPKWRFLLCFVGFLVSISWISTIANEVVGVLKAIGVILGISDAILGLTIFAVGNSLGDLVADITVARLGFPVMALSACFGGPLLNILLGIGISGLYMTLREGAHRHKKHPDKVIKYKPFEIEVSMTLMISAFTLLITLVALLIVVPLNKWRMDKRIGWGLIALWGVSTVGNLVIEITGVADK